MKKLCLQKTVHNCEEICCKREQMFSFEKDYVYHWSDTCIMPCIKIDNPYTVYIKSSST